MALTAWPDRPVPVFPLPNVVLFPHVTIPLHVFELRYRTMLREVLSSDRHLAMALLRPGWELDYQGSPAFHDVVCLATVGEVAWLPNDCYDLTVRGVARARVTRVAREFPYRAVRLDPLPEHPHGADDPLVRIERESMLEVARHLAGAIPAELGTPEDLGLETLTNILCTYAPFDPEQKQLLLAEDHVTDRARRVREGIEHWRASGGGQPPAGESGPN